MAKALTLRLPRPAADLQGYLRAVQSFPLLSAEEEHRLALRYQREQDLDAAWQLVTSHLRYVVKVARGYRGYGLAQEDLIQEGNIGLMKAVKRFDANVGARFVSFAVHWIRAAIHEFVLRNWRIVKVATTKAQRKLFFNLRGVKKRLGWLSREEAHAVAEDMGVRVDDVREMEQRLQAHDARFDAGDDDAREDYHPAPAACIEDMRYEPAAAMERIEWREFAAERITDALERLDERSRDIVTRRWLHEPKARLRELAEQYGISIERVRQIERESFTVLRDAIEHPPGPPG